MTNEEYELERQALLEKHFNNQRRADFIRRGLYVVFMVIGLALLGIFDAHWGFYIAWFTVGFIIIINIVGFLTIPLYSSNLLTDGINLIEKRMESRGQKQPEEDD